MNPTNEQIAIIDREENEKFFSKVHIVPGECWIFLGGWNQDRYGNFWVNGVCDKAHRHSYRLFKGEIPTGMLICHTCDNPPCINPDHLYAGTNTDNTRDKMDRGRFASVDGANNPSAFLTEELARDVHAHLHYTYMTQQAIADKFKITKGHVNNIKFGRAWPNLYKEIYDVTYRD